MSRPTTIQHPLATLRKAVDLGRDQMSTRLKMSRPALEKVERGRNPLTALLRERVFAATGVCPDWLATQDGPIHSCDGYPFDQDQLSRWEKWCEQPPIPSAPLGVAAGIGARKLGPLYRRTCCPGPDRILAHAPAEAVGGTQLDARQWQFGSRALARCGRKLYDERRAPTQFTLAPDPAVHGFHHLLHDGQAQAG